MLKVKSSYFLRERIASLGISNDLFLDQNDVWAQ